MSELEAWLSATARPDAGRWEYVVQMCEPAPEAMHAMLNLFGSYGWELVSAESPSAARIAGVDLSGPAGVRCVFKRPCVAV